MKVKANNMIIVLSHYPPAFFYVILKEKGQVFFLGYVFFYMKIFPESIDIIFPSL